ncbi:helix-turn-helix domain-containing protein [Algoriphagus sp. AGSA1]|uniref:helix-turn-helix domain-containing protein n=1 Tax=Algoriphagus sp. AGSA1 TaxID=2907213 RepID=UPI001F2C3123|nr:helix-turn-helix domain-containing protein [Algoriphagus sp. AGSA1]
MKRYRDFEKKFGEKAKELRLERGLTQEGLAHLAKVTQAQISRLESGVGGTTLTTIINVSVALGYYPKFLFDVQVELPLNQNFKDQLQRKPVVPILIKLVEEGKLHAPKKVSEILDLVSKELGVEIKSSSTSRALGELVKNGVISKKPAAKGRVYLYYKIN